jgi:ABC-2 family transporter protein
MRIKQPAPSLSSIDALTFFCYTDAFLSDPFVNKFKVPFYAPDTSSAAAVVGSRNTKAAGGGTGLLGGLSLSPFIYPGALPISPSDPLYNKSFEQTQTEYDGTFLNLMGSDRNNPVYQKFISTENSRGIDVAYETATVRVPDAAALGAKLFDDWFRGGLFNPYYSAYGFNKIESSASNGTGLSMDVVVYYNETEADDNNCTESCELFSSIQRLEAAVFKKESNGKTATAYLRQMPETKSGASLNFIGLVISIFLGLFAHFLLPTFLGLIVYERKSRVRELLSSMGMRTSTYWTGSTCHGSSIFEQGTVAPSCLFSRLIHFISHACVHVFLA